MYFLPNRKTLSAYYQALGVELPQGGAPLHLSQKWDALAQMDTQEQTRILDTDTILWGLAGSFVGASAYVSPAGLAAGVFLNIYHIHQGQQRALFNKPRPLDSVCGSGQLPFQLKPTYLFLAGDQVMIEVKSTDAQNALAVEVVLFCNKINQAVAQ
jgi:hypothetical protein